MGRKPRVEYRGGVYHVIQRGNNRDYIRRSSLASSIDASVGRMPNKDFAVATFVFGDAREFGNALSVFGDYDIFIGSKG